MIGDSSNSRRAERLLRWYPSAWRERYGEEFADHLEQEFSERRVDFKRTLNIVHKGLVARFADIGISNGSLISGGQSRAALSTSVALLAFSTLLVLNFWSWAMLQWSARPYHPFAVNATTGILTAVAGLLVLVLLAVMLVVLVSAAHQIAHGRGQRIFGPLVLAAVAVAYFYFCIPWLPQMFVGYSHLSQGGLRWIHPGPAAYELAFIAHFATQPWVSMWDPGISGEPASRALMNDLAPLVVVLFAVAVALLVRRVELPRFSQRVDSATVIVLGVLSGVFLVTLVVWFAVDEPTHAIFGESGKIAGTAYAVLLALVTVLVARSGVLARRHKPHFKRNDVEILDIKGASNN